jgi:hypothetical protein
MAEIAEVRGEGGVYARMRVRWGRDGRGARSAARATLLAACAGGVPLEGVLFEGVAEAQSPLMTYARWTYFGRAERTHTRLDWPIFNRASSCV